MIAREYGRNPERLENLFGRHGITFSRDEFVQIMKNGDAFLAEIVNPLYKDDIEVMDMIDLPRTRCSTDCPCADIDVKA